MIYKIQEQIEQILAREIRDIVAGLHLNYEELQEIRMRTGQPLSLIYQGEEAIPTLHDGAPFVVNESHIVETLEYVSNYSLYAYEQEMKQGFITIEGGHRVGMAGKTVVEQEHIKNLSHISSLNIRVAHEVIGCATEVLPFVTENRQICHTLIVSPPRCGKTTMLRDMIRLISNGNKWVKGCSVGVVDERSEIGGCYLGVAQNQLGMRTDILDCCPKAEGMIMLIRSMAPQVIAVDEIGGPLEVHAIEYAMHCGCKMLATVHAASMDELQKRPIFSKLIREKRFERYVFLDNRNHMGEVTGIYDARGNKVYTECIA